MDRPQRRFLACLTAVAALVALLQGLSGVTELALYGTPLLLLAALLLSGRFVAEDRIVARWRAGAPPRRSRPAPARWRPAIELALASLLERTPRLMRGPPAALAPTA